MTTYIIRRLLQGILIIFLVTVFVFLAMRMMPGDPIMLIVGQQQVREYSQEEIEALRRKYHLDKPIYAQYGHWIIKMAKGDFGESLSPADSKAASQDSRQSEE